MPKVDSVDPLTLNKWLNNDEAILIDVREIQEFSEERIGQAINFPLSEVILKMAQLKYHPSKKIVMQCRSGYRSMLACQTLQADDVDYDTYNLEGGIIAWKNCNLPTQN